MPIIRKQLKPADVYPDDIRYNPDTETVQTKINGTWTDSPQADPRHQTIFPPRVTSDTTCDAAESVKDAIKGQIDQILTAIDNSGTAFTIAGLILSLFTFGVFGIFISIALTIANAMLDAGTTALSAALNPTTYHTFACIINCNMDGNGRLTADSLAQAESDITDQIGGLGAVILNSMLALAGEGGVNNLAALGTSTGDCSDCDCGWCYAFDYDLGWGSFASFAQCTTNSSITPDGWEGQCNSCSYFDTSIEITFSGHVTDVYFEHYLDAASASPDTAILIDGGIEVDNPAPVGTSIIHVHGDWTGSHHWQFIANCQCTTFTRIVSVKFKGRDGNPFGTDNCP